MEAMLADVFTTGCSHTRGTVRSAGRAVEDLFNVSFDVLQYDLTDICCSHASKSSGSPQFSFVTAAFRDEHSLDCH
jgi:hypothetical protein